jgi:hypothetical protein
LFSAIDDLSINDFKESSRILFGQIAETGKRDGPLTKTSETEGILGLNRPFLGLNRGKIRVLMLLIRQQCKNASY